jgi:hypothetical protein
VGAAQVGNGKNLDDRGLRDLRQLIVERPRDSAVAGLRSRRFCFD